VRVARFDGRAGRAIRRSCGSRDSTVAADGTVAVRLPLAGVTLAYRWQTVRVPVHAVRRTCARTIQDEELAVTERSAGLPSQKQVIELLEGEFARAGYEIEDVVIDATTRPPRLTVIADGDDGLDLDTIATLSRSASELLDRVDDESAPYVLEVTSPGVDRPLTTEKHYRRARGRKAELTLSDGSVVTGRLGETESGTVRLVVREGRQAKLTVRELPLADIAKAVVQVDFSPPNKHELELTGQSEKEASR
jgi:ribosome maturation factor RimP